MILYMVEISLKLHVFSMKFGNPVNMWTVSNVLEIIFRGMGLDGNML